MLGLFLNLGGAGQGPLRGGNSEGIGKALFPPSKFFHVFPEKRRRVEIIQSGYRATERNRPEVLLDTQLPI